MPLWIIYEFCNSSCCHQPKDITSFLEWHLILKDKLSKQNKKGHCGCSLKATANTSFPSIIKENNQQSIQFMFLNLFP